MSRTLGPRQQREVRQTAEHVALWARDLLTAIEANDVDRAEQLQDAMTRNLASVRKTLGRAKKS